MLSLSPATNYTVSSFRDGNSATHKSAQRKKEKERDKEKEKERSKDIEVQGREDLVPSGTGTGSGLRSELRKSNQPTPLSFSSKNTNALSTPALLTVQQQRLTHQESYQIDLSSTTEGAGICNSLSVDVYPNLEGAYSCSEECSEPLDLFSRGSVVEKDMTNTLRVMRQSSDSYANEGRVLEKHIHGMASQMPPPTSMLSRNSASNQAHIDSAYSSSTIPNAAPILDPILVARALSKVPPFARAGLKKRMEQQQLQQQRQMQLQNTVSYTGAAEGASGNYETAGLSSLPLDQEERREMLGSQWEIHRQKVRPVYNTRTI